ARHPAQLYICIGVSNVGLDLLERSCREKAGGGANERNLAPIGESGAHADHSLFSDTDIDETVGELALEAAQFAGADAVVHDRHDPLVGLCQLLHRAGVGIPAIKPAIGRCGDGAHRESSSIACVYWSALGIPWCQLTWSSMKEMPLPLMVWAMRHSGLVRATSRSSKEINCSGS